MRARRILALAGVSIFLFSVMGFAADGGDAKAADQIQLQRAVTPLVDFATWCSKNKAQSAGQAALAEARKISPDAPAISDADAALQSATDDAPVAMVASRRNNAYSAAASNIDRVVAFRSHGKSADASSVPLQLEAISLSPNGRIFGLAKIGLAAEKAGDADNTQQAMMLALRLKPHDLLTNKSYQQLASNLSASGTFGPAIADLAKATLADKSLGNRARLEAAALLGRVASLDNKGMDSGVYDAATAVMDDSLTLIGTADNPSVGYVSLPPHWKPGVKYPILLCFPGDGTGYEWIGGSYRDARGDAPYIVLAPVIFCNCNNTSAETHGKWYGPDITSQETFSSDTTASMGRRLQFDKPGIFALLKATRTYLGGNKIYVTGFSGGGIACYLMLLQIPSEIAAGAPACANYFMEPPPGRGMGAPVMQFFGQNDPFMDHIGNGPGLREEGQEAAKALQSAGYRQIGQTIVDGKSHDAMVQQVVEFFNKVRNAQGDTSPKSTH
jgi:dienelactone hydrolase